MRVTVAGLTKRIDEMREMAARMKDLTPAMQVAAAALTKAISDRFRSATAWDGSAWRPLAASTVRQRRKKSNKILQDTGVLKNSISVTAGKRSITFGTAVPYAGIHQFGGTTTRGARFQPVNRRGKFQKRKTGTHTTVRSVRYLSGGTSTIPARSFLPVVKAGGKFAMATGAPAEALATRIRKYLATYIRTGKVG